MEKKGSLITDCWRISMLRENERRKKLKQLKLKLDYNFGPFLYHCFVLTNQPVHPACWRGCTIYFGRWRLFWSSWVVIDCLTKHRCCDWIHSFKRRNKMGCADWKKVNYSAVVRHSFHHCFPKTVRIFSGFL